MCVGTCVWAHAFYHIYKLHMSQMVCYHRLETLQNFYSRKVLQDALTGVWELSHKEKTS